MSKVNPMLSEYGLKQVNDATNFAIERFRRAKRELEAAGEEIDFMHKVVNCEHELEVTGSFILIEQTCKKCGFTWVE